MSSQRADEGKGSFFRKNLVSIRDLSKADIEKVLEESERMRKALDSGERLDLLKDKIMAVLFYEPSTRTRLSFESAMHRLGGSVLGFSDAASSSATKGETLEDTIRIVSAYADVIVLRHKQEGVAKDVSKLSKVPIINAGDGSDEHPTQALLDLFTVKKEKGKLSGLKIAIVGDLKNGRTVHSFAYAAGMFGNEIIFIAPEELQIPKKISDDIVNDYHCKVTKKESLDDALDADVVYIPRVQKERFTDLEQYLKFANRYKVDNNFLKKAKKDVIIMSPLPRTTEIATDIDNLKNAVYFKQAANGVPVRMALLKMILQG